MTTERLIFLLKRIREKLWFRPLLLSALSVAGAFLSRISDYLELGRSVPEVQADTIEHLLSIMAASMLVMATLAVGTMVSAYASAGATATPRSFPLVVADDVSQNSFSAFLGAFIFSIVSLIAVENGYYGRGGRFTLLLLTLLVFAAVILTFLAWVDNVARLGRLGTTIDKVENATMTALERRRKEPTLGAKETVAQADRSNPIYSTKIGYVQMIDLSNLQKKAEQAQIFIQIAVLPGSFVNPGKPLAYLTYESERIEPEHLVDDFQVAHDRTFHDDPRFGLIVMGEIASKALSPGINDPGTAIDVLGSMTRLFYKWNTLPEGEKADPRFDRLSVPRLSQDDMLEDAFRAIARDGAGCIEVVLRLLKTFECLASLGDDDFQSLVCGHARAALSRAEAALSFEEDLVIVRRAAAFALER